MNRFSVRTGKYILPRLCLVQGGREIMEGAVVSNEQIAWCVVGQKQLCVTINVLRAMSDQVQQMMGFET